MDNNPDIKTQEEAILKLKEIETINASLSVTEGDDNSGDDLENA